MFHLAEQYNAHITSRFVFFLNGWNFITVFKWNDWTLVHAHAQAQKLSNLSKRCTDVQAFINIHSQNPHRSRTYALVCLDSTCSQFLGGFQRYIVWRTREERARCTRNTSYMPALRAASETIKRQEQLNWYHRVGKHQGSSVCSRMAILNSSLLTAGSLPSVQKQVNKCQLSTKAVILQINDLAVYYRLSEFVVWLYLVCVCGGGGGEAEGEGRGGMGFRSVVLKVASSSFFCFLTRV